MDNFSATGKWQMHHVYDRNPQFNFNNISIDSFCSLLFGHYNQMNIWSWPRDSILLGWRSNINLKKNSIKHFSAIQISFAWVSGQKRPILLCTNNFEQVNLIRSLLLLLLSFATIDFGQLQFFLVSLNQISLGRRVMSVNVYVISVSICILRTPFTQRQCRQCMHVRRVLRV